MTSLSEEEENYVRIGLLLTGISSRAARTLSFDTCSEFAPVCLDATINKKYNKLLDLMKQKKISRSQWNVLFPIYPDVTKSDTFDITLIITLIRNLTDLSPPRYGFDSLPTVNESTPGSDLARKKYYRNYFAHFDDRKVDTTFYKTAWENLSRTIGPEECPPGCNGIPPEALSERPSEKHLVRLASVLDITMFHDFFLHLGMETRDLHNIQYSYWQPVDVMFMALMKWRDTDSIVTFKKILDAQKNVDDNQHHLCQVLKEHTKLPDQIMCRMSGKKRSLTTWSSSGVDAVIKRAKLQHSDVSESGQNRLASCNSILDASSTKPTEMGSVAPVISTTDYIHHTPIIVPTTDPSAETIYQRYNPETAGFRLGDTPSDSFLSALPKKLGYCVLTLGIELGLRVTDIEAVFVRYPRDLFSQVYEVLKIWKQKTPENTYLNLMLAIQRVRGKQFLERNFGCDN